jgi:hypothetical protein
MMSSSWERVLLTTRASLEAFVERGRDVLLPWVAWVLSLVRGLVVEEVEERLGRLRKVSFGRRPLRRFIIFERVSVMAVAALVCCYV